MENSTASSNVINFAKESTTNLVNQLSEFLQVNIPNNNLSQLVLIFLGLLLIWIASSVTKRVAKFGLIIVGGLLIVGSVLNFLGI